MLTHSADPCCVHNLARWRVSSATHLQVGKYAGWWMNARTLEGVAYESLDIAIEERQSL